MIDICPFMDAAGNRILDGDRLRHPDGTGLVARLAYCRERNEMVWQADYGDESPPMFLGLQVDPERGMAAVEERQGAVAGIVPVFQTRDGQDGNCFAACCATLLGGEIAEWEADAETAEDIVKRTFAGKCDWLCVAPGKGESLSCGQFLAILCVRNRKTGLGHAVVVHQNREGSEQWYDVVHDPSRTGGFDLDDFDEELLVVPLRSGSFITSRGNR